MDQADKLRGLLGRRVVFLDGASGTELMKRGMPRGSRTELWALDNRDTLMEMHGDYVRSGADVILTCTFGGTGIKLGDADMVERVNHELAVCALKAASGSKNAYGDPVLTGASIGPTGRLLHPSGDLSWEEAYGQFRKQASALADAGIGIFFLETFSDPRELKAAALAVRDTCPGGFISAQMSFETHGLSLSGTSPTALSALMEQLPVDACGANCSQGPEELLPVIQEMVRFSGKPIAVEPNAGLPVDGKWEMTPERFAEWMEDFAWGGASLIGGCCGTGPEHVREYVSMVGSRPVSEVEKEELKLLTSVDRTVRLDQGLLTVGESINPTGRKSLQKSISNGDFFAVVSLARAQGRADVIDVNLGLEKLLPRGFVHEVFSRLSIGPPLSVDLSGPGKIRTAFQEMGGIGILNSLIADEEFISERIDILLRHGGYAVLLPVDRRGPGDTPEERMDILKRGLAILEERGFSGKRVIADPLVRPVATGDGAGVLFRTLELLKKDGHLTIAGISNVSHGMPGRGPLNASLLAALGTRGLDLAIADVLDPGIVSTHRSVRILDGRMERLEMKLPELDPQSASPDFMAILRKSIIIGDRRQTEASARELLEAGTDPRKIIETGLAPAMEKVGELYSRRKLFLPHLIAAAEASRVLMSLLTPRLEEGGGPESRGKVVLASVRGDVHDIGKNLVALFLSNAGFSVVDLGKDVDCRTIVDRAEEEDADIIALSALMSTTAPEMEKVVKLVRERGIRAGVMVGGAVITGDYAGSIGADGYARNAFEAVSEAVRILEGG